MTQGEANELRNHFTKQFEDVLISERSDLNKIFELIDRCAKAEQAADDAAWARDGGQWGR